jgi:hypothetical protein
MPPSKWINQGKENFEKALKATEKVNGTCRFSFRRLPGIGLLR